MSDVAGSPDVLSEGRRAGVRTDFLRLPADEQRRISAALRRGEALDDAAGRTFQYALLARGRTWRQWAPVLGMLLFIGQLGLALSSGGERWLRAILALGWLGMAIFWAGTRRRSARVERELGLTSRHFP